MDTAFGWYPDRKVRLYNREKGKWVGDFVHESWWWRAGRQPGKQHPALHLRIAGEHVKTMDRYTTLGAGVGGAPDQGAVWKILATRRGRSGRLICCSAAFRMIRRLIIAYMPVSTSSLSTRKREHELMRILHMDAGREMRGGHGRCCG